MHSYIAVPTTLALVYRAYSHKSLTPLGIAAAAVTATIHAIHPWSAFFALLVAFFLGGTSVTKVLFLLCRMTFDTRSLTIWQVKHNVKARLTFSSSGLSGGEGARTHIQVLANSVVASVLILLHYRKLLAEDKSGNASQDCMPYGHDLLAVGIVRY